MLMNHFIGIQDSEFLERTHPRLLEDVLHGVTWFQHDKAV
jgi:hypothetical protein